ncbi:hypothetical protein [Cellulomonas citrea]|uniref:hypothetical protein n=1 Tax=Cellulomonas citrea TaxID=1909423 RepID=UPI00135867D4|nr:hypothetical protein [Cellulomonas citrea]
MSFLLAALRLRAMESQHYWRLRAYGQAVGASATSVQVSARRRARGLAGLLSIGSRALGGSLLLLCVPIVGLWVTQRAPQVHRWTESLEEQVPKWAQDFGGWITSSVDPEFDSTALLTAAIGVAGVFVAVYFASVTFVVSTTYEDATRRLRDHIVRQPESGWYATFFTQAVVYTAGALALPLLDQAPTNLTLALAGVAAALVVVSFGRIWATLFLLLEPTSLFPQIQRTLNRWIRRAHVLGRRKMHSLVSVRRSNVGIREGLETLNDLVTLILDREHERAGGRGKNATDDPRIGTALRYLQVAWLDYAQVKHTIRTLPGWSPRRTQAKDWFLSSHSEVSVALATGTTLPASEVVDELWFERWLADFFERVLAGRDLSSVERAVRGLPPLSRTLGAYGQFAEMRLWLAAATFAPMNAVSDFAGSREALAFSVDSRPVSGRGLSREEHLALPDEAGAHNLVDCVMLEALSACLGYADYCERMRRSLPDLPSYVLNRSEHLPAGGLVTQGIENLREAISFEYRIEGQRITPDNAIVQLIARALATEAVDELSLLVAYVEAELWPWVLKVGQVRAWAAGAALSRAYELTEKLGTATRAARALLDACEAVHLEHDDRWPDTRTAVLDQRTRALADLLEMPIARLAAMVDPAPDSDRPDHFGWAYYRAHENLLRRVLECDPGDAEELRQKATLLYWAGDVATKRLLATVRQNDPSVISSYVAEPHLRLLQLSGIALVVSEVRGDRRLFAPFDAVWKYALADREKATEVLARAAATLASETLLFGLTAGGIDRSNIEMRANRAIEEFGVPAGLFEMGAFGGRYARTSQKNLKLGESTMRLLRDVRAGHFEGAFYVRWLRPQAIGTGATPPTETERYLRLLDFGDVDGDDDDND